MRSSLSLFVLMAVLLVAALGAAPPGEPAPDVPRDDALATNARRLEEWRKDPEHFARLQRDRNAFRRRLAVVSSRPETGASAWRSSRNCGSRSGFAASRRQRSSGSPACRP